MAWFTTSTLVWVLAAMTIARTNAKPALTDECGRRPADVVFVLDVSSSIWPVDFEKRVLKFVHEVVDSMHIGSDPEHTRVGAVTFSTRIQLEFYLHQHMDKDLLLKRIKQIKSRGGDTNTHEALTFVDNYLFKPENGGRSNVSRIVIVITDGASRETMATLEAARALRNHGVVLFAIGVGNQVKMEQLIGMASQPSSDFVFEVTNFNSLANIKSELVFKTCRVEAITTTVAPTTTTKPSTTTTTEPTTTTTTSEPTTTTTSTTTTTTEPSTTITTTEEPITTTPTEEPTTTTSEEPNTATTASTTTENDQNDSPQGDMDTVACINLPAEVYFVLDSSNSIWRVDFERSMLDFVRDVIDIFDVGSDRTRVGVITFSDTPRTIFGLGSHEHKDELLKAVNKDNVRYDPGLTFTAEALQRALINLRSEGREGVQQIIILITDGHSRNPNATVYVARAARSDGITLFTVGVGDGVDTGELHAVASQPSEQHVLVVDDFTGLAASKDLLAARTCNTIHNASALTASEMELLRPFGDQSAPEDKKCALQHTDLLVAYDGHAIGSIVATQLLSSLHHLSATFDIIGADITIGTVTSTDCRTPSSSALSGTMLFDKHVKSVLRVQHSSIAGILKTARLSGFSEKNGYRPSARKVVLAILDAAATSRLSEVAAEAQRLRSEDVEVFIVTSGVQGRRLVHEAASEPTSQHVIVLPGLDFSSYAHVSDLLVRALCTKMWV